MAHHPVIQRAVSRPGVEGNQRPARPDPGHVRHAADVEHRERRRHAPRQSGVEHRRKRRALAACSHVGRAEIVRHGHAGPPGEFACVADLPGPPPVRLVQDGLAVEADEVRLPPERRHRADVILGQPRRGALQAPVVRVQSRRALQDAPQVRTQPFVVRQRQGRPEFADPFAVGFQPRRIDAIQRGAAHQPDRAQHFPVYSLVASVCILCDTRSQDAMVKSAFLQEATERGFVFQCTDVEALDAALRDGTVTAYIGFDCTADSLHVGSLVQIMILRLLQRHGHRPLVLMGGGTTRIGDPSGKDEIAAVADG